jgi:hypothetical protein
MSWIVPVLEWGPGKTKIVFVSAHDPAVVADDELRKAIYRGEVQYPDPRIKARGEDKLTEFFFRPIKRQEWDAWQLRASGSEEEAGRQISLTAFWECILAVVVGDERLVDREVIGNSVPLEVKIELGSRLVKLCTRVPSPLSGR